MFDQKGKTVRIRRKSEEMGTKTFQPYPGSKSIKRRNVFGVYRSCKETPQKCITKADGFVYKGVFFWDCDTFLKGRDNVLFPTEKEHDGYFEMVKASRHTLADYIETESAWNKMNRPGIGVRI